jgi:magnesium-transporting ATPase (P-type)
VSDWVAGYVMGMVVGIGAGFAIGLAAGKKQKSWSELTEREKKIRKLLIVALSVLAGLGAIVFALLTFGLQI